MKHIHTSVIITHRIITHRIIITIIISSSSSSIITIINIITIISISIINMVQMYSLFFNSASILTGYKAFFKYFVLSMFRQFAKHKNLGREFSRVHEAAC